MWVSRSGECRLKILDEAHKLRYSIHPGTTKMYQDLRKDCWWPSVKFKLMKYVAKCLTCSQVKVEHQKPYDSYHASIGMPPNEILYGMRCRTLMCWGEVGHKELGSKKIVQTMAEKIDLIKIRMIDVQDRRKLASISAARCECESDQEKRLSKEWNVESPR
ncbi:hypothetical protein L1987_45514 [Smallanthus sonchifolius]|uniref:Uncharacterized protein n=1 Tax=Smallanthus sonchifolius TaxID=185202 RepID=A0ACB9FXT6_9ASTR|nr:hypothetical protein L1987_45514 [Smallanthus sonchifolius]